MSERSNRGAYRAGPNLRLRRIASGWTQRDLAGIARIDRGHLTNIERGTQAFGSRVAVGIAAAFRMSVPEAIEAGIFMVNDERGDESEAEREAASAVGG